MVDNEIDAWADLSEMPRTEFDDSERETLDMLAKSSAFTDEEDSENDAEKSFSVQRNIKREARKPDIDHLPDCVVDGKFLGKPGDKIVIEHYASMLKDRPWLKTCAYSVIAIDEVRGDLKLIDVQTNQNALSNYITGVEYGYRFKFAAKTGNPIGARRKRRKVVPTKSVPPSRGDAVLDELVTLGEAQALKPKAPKSRSRRVYFNKKLGIHTGYAGKQYRAPENTSFQPGTEAFFEESNGSLVATSLDGLRSEVWALVQ